jgi:NaMN:DMB phosphoribosyltransferase
MTGLETGGVPEARVRALQITMAALIIGLLFFAGIDVVLQAQGKVPLVPGLEVISYVAAGYAVVILGAWLVVMRATASAARKKLLAAPEVTTQRVIELYAGRMITGAALLEGIAFFFLTAYLIAGQPWTLAGGLVSAALLALVHFPTRRRVEDWVTATREAVEQERLGL